MMVYPKKLAASFIFLAASLASPAMAGTIEIRNTVAHLEHDPEHGSRIEIFLTIVNSGTAMDRIYAVRSQIAKKGQISGGVDQHAAAGQHADHTAATAVNLPAGQTTELFEEGSHLELAELKAEPKPGDEIDVTLFFEKAGPMTVKIAIADENH